MLKKAVKFVTNNFGLKILALLFAVILWLVVVNVNDPVQTRSYTTSVNIENDDAIANMGKYYEIVNDSNTVTFKVSAKRSVFRMLNSTDFRATADMSRIEDMSRVPIEIIATRYASSITFTSRTQYLEVSVEDLQKKRLVISADYEGNPADGCAVESLSINSVNMIEISGPKSVVSTVDSAKAIINVDGQSDSITDSVVPLLVDADGKPVDTTKLTLSLQTVNIRAEIRDVKSVAVEADVGGAPREGYVYTGISFSPAAVQVKGTGAVLNTVNTIKIPEGIIDVDGKTETFTQIVDVTSYMPDGISIVNDADKKVTATVTIEKKEVRAVEMPTKNIIIHNIPEGYRAEYVNDSVEVYISGLSEDLDRLSVRDLTATIDVGGLGEGEHTVALVLELDDERYSLNGTQTVMIRLVSGDEPSSQGGTQADIDSKSSESSGNDGQGTEDNSESETDSAGEE